MCRGTWEDSGKEPNCDVCIPILMPENAEAAMIYNIIQDQVIPTGSRIMPLNQLAVWEVIDRYGIENPVRVFERILFVAREFLKKEVEKMEAGK